MMKKIIIISAILLAIFLSAGCSEGTVENTTAPTLQTTTAPTLQTTTAPTTTPTTPTAPKCVVGSPIGCFDGTRKVVPRSETNSTTGDSCLVTIKNVTSDEQVLLCW